MRPQRSRNLARTLTAAAIVAGAVWLAVAAVAVIRPEALPNRAPLLGLRYDTTGAVCFLLAGLLALAGGVVGQERRGRARWTGPALRVLAVQSTAGWLYILGNAIAHPQTLGLGLTHFYDRPSETEFGVACLLVSVTTWAVLRRRARPAP